MPRKFFLAIALAIASTALSRAQPVTLVDDTFADGNRTVQNLPDSLAWYAPGGAVGSISVRAGSLSLFANNDDRLIWGYFPARTLAAGDSLTLTLAFSFSRTPPAGTGSFKVALCSSNGRPLRQSDGGPPTGAYEGYASFTNPAGASAGTRIRKRNGPAAANTTATLLELSDGPTDTVWDTFGAARSGIASTLQGNTPYTLTLQITRTGAMTARLSTTISGGTLATENTLVELDDRSVFTTFDTIAIGAAEAVQSGDLTITRVQLVHDINTTRLSNLSILTDIATSGDSFTLGYVVGGGTNGPKPLVIRAAGPSLGALGVDGALADPKLELFTGSGKTGENDNWGGGADLTAAMAAVGAFAFAPATSRDAAVLASVVPGASSSVTVSANGNGTGTVIAEIYDATPAAAFSATTPRLVNVSVRKHLGTGLTLGFVVAGSGTKNVLIRAIGPTLGDFGVDGVVADPQLAVFSGTTQVAANDNWAGAAPLTTAFAQVGAFGLPANSRDAAVLASLAPGNYTVEVKGTGASTGVALVEVYEVQ